MSQTLSGNPMLLNPTTMADMGPAAALAAAQARAITAPLPATRLDHVRHYVCLIKNHQMHRNDGLAIHFLNGHHATDMFHTANYLENEIDAGSQYVRAATPDEIRNYNMMRDPTGTITAELAPKLEAEMRSKLELELQMAMAMKLDDIGVVMTEDQKKILAQMFMDRRDEEPEVTTTVQPGSDEAKIAQTEMLSRLRATTTGVKTGTATVFVPSTSQAPALGGISGTDKMANAGDSNSISGK